jgi:hypothetical protein
MSEEKKGKIAQIVVAVCLIIILVCIGAFFAITSIINHNNKFDYQESLGDTAITVGEEEISLKEVSYYILVAETTYNEAAHIYNSDNLDSFWNININHKYFKQTAKESVINACIRDNVYYQQAREEGYALSMAEEEEVDKKAVEEMNKITDNQREITQYTLNDMKVVLKKIKFAKDYVADLMQDGYTEEQLDTGGSKYEEIASNYKVKQNDNIWKNITLGTVTINHE